MYRGISISYVHFEICVKAFVLEVEMAK